MKAGQKKVARFAYIVLAILAAGIFFALNLRQILQTDLVLQPVTVFHSGRADAVEVGMFTPLGSEIVVARSDGRSTVVGRAVASIIISSNQVGTVEVRVGVANRVVHSEKIRFDTASVRQVDLLRCQRTSFVSSYYGSAINYRGDRFVFTFGLISSLIFGCLIWAAFKIKLELCSAARDLYVLIIAGNSLVVWSISGAFLCACLLLNMRFADPLSLSYRMVDEPVLVIRSFKQALTFWNGHYGTAYHLLQSIVAIPGLTLGSHEVAVTGQRMLSSVGCVICMIATVKACSGFGKLTRWYSLLLLFSMPGFWSEAVIIRPDTLMTAGVCVAVVAAARMPAFRGMRGCALALGLATAIKVQALMYLPLLLFFAGFRVRQVIRNLVIFTVSWAILDFRLLLPGGVVSLVKAAMVVVERSGGGVGGTTRISSKLNLVSEFFVPFPYFVLMVLSCVVCLLVSFRFRSKKLDQLAGVNFSIFVAVVYYMVFLKYAWTSYYFSLLIPLTVCVLFNVSALAAHAGRFSARFVPCLMIILCSTNLLWQGKRVFRQVKDDFWISVSAGVDVQERAWRAVKEIIVLRDWKRTTVLCSPLLAFNEFDVEFGGRVSVERLYLYDNVGFATLDPVFLSGFNVFYLKKFGQESVSPILLRQFAEWSSENGYFRAYEDDLAVVWCRGA